MAAETGGMALRMIGEDNDNDCSVQFVDQYEGVGGDSSWSLGRRGLRLCFISD